MKPLQCWKPVWPTAADIDKAVKLGLNHPMGPFEMVDLVGLDVRLKILEYLHRPWAKSIVPVHYSAICGEGRLGRKSGHGVYDYEKPQHDQHRRVNPSTQIFVSPAKRQNICT